MQDAFARLSVGGGAGANQALMKQRVHTRARHARRKTRSPRPPARRRGAREHKGREAPERFLLGGTTCVDCHYWLPFSLLPRIGECDNQSSTHFRKPVFSDKAAEDCFLRRSLEGLEFMWCLTHQETIHYTDMPYHGGCRIFSGSANLPVEDQAEMTLPG